MTSFEVYKAQKMGEMSDVQKELNMIESSGLDVLVSHNRWGRKELVVNDYSLADNFFLRRSCGCCEDAPYFVEFTAEVNTPFGDLHVFTRHDKWYSNPFRVVLDLNAFGSVNEYSAKNHLSKVIEYFNGRGVNDRVLKKLEQGVNELIVSESIDCIDEDVDL